MTHSWFLLVICALATHRTSRLVVTDEATKPLREWLRVHGFKTLTRTVGAAQESKLVETNRVYAWMFKLSSCHWCTSLWAAAFIVALIHFQTSWFQYVAYALALSSVSGVIQEKATHGE